MRLSLHTIHRPSPTCLPFRQLISHIVLNLPLLMPEVASTFEVRLEPGRLQHWRHLLAVACIEQLGRDFIA